MRIGIIAALPGELKQLVRTRWERLPVAKGSGVRMWQAAYGEDEVIAVCAGMGPAAALRAFTAAEYRGSLDMVLSVGWAGALVADTRAGTVYVPSVVVDAQTGERFELTDGKRKLVLVTSPVIAGEADKRRLASSYGAMLVDMEAATVLRLAAMRGIPAACLKAVSDALDEDLPELGRFVNELGQLKLVPFLLHVAQRPRYWGPLVRLGRASGQGSHALAAAITELLNGTKDLAVFNRRGVVSGAMKLRDDGEGMWDG